MVLGNLDFNIQKMKLDPYVSACTKPNFKWMKDPNARPSSLELLKEKGEYTQLLGTGKDSPQIL